MKTLKALAALVALTFALCLSAPAQTSCHPGDVETPPCTGAQMTSDDLTISAEASGSSTSVSTVVEISETTIDVLLSALSIF